MNLVDKEHIVGFERGEYAGKVAWLVEHGAAGNLESHSQLVGDDVAQRGLTQSGRAVQQGVVEGFAAVLGCLDKNFKVLDYLLLAREIAEAKWSERVLELLLRRRHRLLPYIKIVSQCIVLLIINNVWCKVSASRAKYKINSFIFIAETKPNFTAIAVGATGIASTSNETLIRTRR